jgi:hypothetical protein
MPTAYVLRASVSNQPADMSTDGQHRKVLFYPWSLGRMWRFAARLSGLASGLALAVRPAGSAEAPALKGLLLRSKRRDRRERPGRLAHALGHESTRAALVYLHTSADRQRTIADQVGKNAKAALGKRKRSGPRMARSGDKAS